MADLIGLGVDLLRKLALTIFTIAIFYTYAAKAEEDTVAFGISRPPYVMQDRATGISVELFKIIYAKLNRQFLPKYFSNARMVYSLTAGLVDVAVEVKKTRPDLFYSKEFVSYQNFIIMRSDEKTDINAFQDLSGLSVCTWQQADEHLGQAFQDAMKSFNYQEFANQDAQVRVFLGGRCDALIIDEKIFKYWVETLRNDSAFEKHIVSTEFVYQPVPGQSKNMFYVGFRDEKLRDRFDQELEKIKANGEYERVINWKDWSNPPS